MDILDRYTETWSLWARSQGRTPAQHLTHVKAMLPYEGEQRYRQWIGEQRVAFCIERGLIYTADKKPNRAEFLEIMRRAWAIPTILPLEFLDFLKARFAAMPVAGSWHKKYIRWASANGRTPQEQFEYDYKKDLKKGAVLRDFHKYAAPGSKIDAKTRTYEDFIEEVGFDNFFLAFPTYGARS